MPTAFLRGRVHATLDRIREGSITLIDGGSRTTCGQRAERRATVRMNDARFYGAVALGGTLGTGESYVAGVWDCDDLFTLFRILARERDRVQALDEGLAGLARPVLRLLERARRNTLRGSEANIAAHYDLGNDLFELFLDPTISAHSATRRRSYACGTTTSPTARPALPSAMSARCN